MSMIELESWLHRPLVFVAADAAEIAVVARNAAIMANAKVFMSILLGFEKRFS